MGFLALCPCASAGEPAPTFKGAQWIWHWPDPAAESPVPGEGRCWFRREVVLPPDAKVEAAEAAIACDNLYALYVRGTFVGQSEPNPNFWNRPKRFDVTGLLGPGRNVIAVEAANTAPGPAGLLAKVTVRLAGGRRVVAVTDGEWAHSEKADKGWQTPGFSDKDWRKVFVVGDYGMGPWGNFDANLAAASLEKPSKKAAGVLTWSHGGGGPMTIPKVTEVAPPDDYPWPTGIIFLGDDCSLYRPRGKTGTSHDSLGVTMFTVRKSRSFPEHDLPAPIKMGRTLYALAPARPGTKPTRLLDAGKGAIGSPSVSFDGTSILVSMAKDDEPFFHIYRLPAEGGRAERLTDGPFHDIDPAELPDGRIVFTSTRIGTFEEYHSPPARALFVMNADGSDIHPITHTIIFDNEPEVLADGRIIFIRSDNFFDRGKVETLLHAVRPDGTDGYTEFGLDMGPEYGGRLRAFYCGSPAPMPNNGLAFVSRNGITVGELGTPRGLWKEFRMAAGDVAALPDGRLIATLARVVSRETGQGNKKKTARDLSYEKIAVLDPHSERAEAVILHDSDGRPLHSPVYLGPRRRPKVLPPTVDRAEAAEPHPTGFLYCQNARFTRHTTAGWPHVRAIRVLAGKGLTTRSSHAYIVHAGNDVTELGTVPLAPDGSFYVEVPADTAIAFQAVDAEGRAELNEMSWVYVRPGERRGCVGCHAPRHATPAVVPQDMQAASVPPVRLLGRGRPHRFRGNNPAVTGLMELQFDRYREVAGLNRHGAAGDPLATGPREVAALVDWLTSDDEGLRVSAAQRLSIFRRRAAAPALAACFSDPSREVRLAAAAALGACGGRESVAPLLDALGDASPLVAQAAAVALENLTGHAGPFNAFADGPARAQQAKAWRDAFAPPDWDAVEADLVQRFASEDRDVVRRAAVALGHVGGEAARTALRGYVGRERKNNPYPEWKKKHRGDGTRFNALSPANPRTLQAAVRSLGYLRDAASVPMLAETIAAHSDPNASNLFLLEACIEALGRIGNPEAEAALIQAMTGLKDYFYYVGWYGDHSALYACHASPAHYFVAEALDAIGSAKAGPIVPHLIRSVPTDPDRALMLHNDDCETVVGRVIRRSGEGAAVVETCLALLGDPQATPTKPIEDAIRKTYAAWAGKPGPEIRAAQVLSLACRDPAQEPRIRAALERYRAKPPTDLVRAFGGSGLPRALPVRRWVCFFLARALGNLGQAASVDALVAVLDVCPPEAASGYPDPTKPEVLFLHNDLTPCYRAAAAWALGEIGDRRAVPVLLEVVGDLANATDTRYAAAEALGRIRDPSTADAVRDLAADYPEVSTRKALLRACRNVP